MRTTFTTAAIIATTSAATLDAMAVPDWVAGFIYGLTGDNHLTEIEQCITGGQGLADDAEAALAKIKSGEFIKGAEAIGKVVNEFPDALVNCESMGDDLAAIEDWAKIFTEPKALAEKASKNWLLHHRAIKEDIANEEAAWDAEQYFQAGLDAAMAVTETVGPITPSAPALQNLDNVEFNVKDALSFVGGLVVGLAGESHQPDFTQCGIDAAIIYKEIGWILGYVHKKEYVMVVKLLVAFVEDLPDTLVSPCEAGISDEFNLLKNWVEGLFEDPGKLIETVAKNLLMHTETLASLVGKIESSAAQDDFFSVGKDVADLFVLATGPI